MVFLRAAGHIVNRKRVQRLMRSMGLAGMAPGPNTSKAHPEHKVYPYLLRGVPVTRPNQVWSTDITYIRLARGFAYLVAVIDWYSRKVLSWRLSNSMDASFCVDCLEDALRETWQARGVQQRSRLAVYEQGVHGRAQARMCGYQHGWAGTHSASIFVERLWRNVESMKTCT